MISNLVPVSSIERDNNTVAVPAGYRNSRIADNKRSGALIRCQRIGLSPMRTAANHRGFLASAKPNSVSTKRGVCIQQINCANKEKNQQGDKNSGSFMLYMPPRSTKAMTSSGTASATVIIELQLQKPALAARYSRETPGERSPTPPHCKSTTAGSELSAIFWQNRIAQLIPE